jgi:hypothetical protein
VNFQVPIPDGAEERARRVATAAFASRKPVPRRRMYWKPAIAIVVVAAIVGALASPPGRSVIDSIREAVGVEKAQRELFSLPSPGRLLVQSNDGPWVVDAGGSKRLLGDYRAASWSPFGRFVVGARANEVIALDPHGTVHWTLSRPAVESPRWGGLRTNTRIAYVARDGLHVVAGDGTGDRLLVPGSIGAFAWKARSLAKLAYVTGSEVRVVDSDSGEEQWRRSRGTNEPVERIAWSASGSELLVVSPHHLIVFDGAGRVVWRDRGASADATFVGGSDEIAVLRTSGYVIILGLPGVLFRAPGSRELVSAPDGRWLLVTWPAADQWVFVRAHGTHAIRAFSGITRQFGGGTFPVVSGWVGE